MLKLSRQRFKHTRIHSRFLFAYDGLRACGILHSSIERLSGDMQASHRGTIGKTSSPA